MRQIITDPEVQLLASLSATFMDDYIKKDDLIWESSPFGWIKTRPSRQVGAIGERLVAGWCAAKGLDVVRSPDSDADRIIGGVRTEIKFLTLWANGNYKFQQLRDQNYKIAICLGISPFDANCWVLTKDIIMEKWGASNGLQTQHGGQQGSDTAWLSVNPSDIQPWLRLCGGSLSSAFNVLEKLVNH